jgi:hypothetical protein
MTNAEFQAKLDTMTKEWLPIASKQMTINELIWILRHDNDVEDYMLNIDSQKEGFSFGFLKESFTPVRLLALKIKSIEYEEYEDSEYPVLAIKTN